MQTFTYIMYGIITACAIGIIILENARVRRDYYNIKSFCLYK